MSARRPKREATRAAALIRRYNAVVARCGGSPHAALDLIDPSWASWENHFRNTGRDWTALQARAIRRLTRQAREHV